MGGPAHSAEDRDASLRLFTIGALSLATGSAPLAPDVVRSISGLAQDFAFDFEMYEWRLGASLPLAPRLSAEVAVPLRRSVTRAHYRDAEGRRVTGLPSDDLHPEESSEAGFGDATVDVHAATADGEGWWLSLTAGASLPTGTTAPDPWLPADQYTGTIRRAFFGTGTVDPRGGVNAGWNLAGVDLGLWGHGAASLYENRWGYRAGPRLGGGLRAGASSALGLDPLHVSLSAELRHDGQATWSGRPARNTGRTDVLAGVGLAWRMTDRWSLDLTVRRPVASWHEGGQVQWPLIVQMGFYGSPATSESGEAPSSMRSKR